MASTVLKIKGQRPTIYNKKYKRYIDIYDGQWFINIKDNLLFMNSEDIIYTIPMSTITPSERRGKVTVAAGLQTILFAINGVPAPLATADWQFDGKPLCYTVKGGVEPLITNRTRYGFDVRISTTISGTIEYKVTL